MNKAPSKPNARTIIATAALPYANGSIHLGHLVEYLQVDIWVRFQKMRGHRCLYICADDTHGTPVMLKARELGITPEQLVSDMREEHLRDFAGFQIEFDNYSSTHTEKNRALCYQFFTHMQNKGLISSLSIDQLFCTHDKMFLPDRFVKGSCPQCGAPDQYGDSCDKCGATYSTKDLKNPYCSLCKNPPVVKASEHLFFKLNEFRQHLSEWVPLHTPKEVANKLQEWLNSDLREWDISRDTPYFGFEIPGYPEKYFYVWVDAPMGYISSTMEWAEKNKKDGVQFWNDPSTEIYHFLGKDIIYFHTLFWPAMLKAAEFKQPDQVFVHGFLTVNGEKMSKSKGTFITARSYLDRLDPMYLRYYYASKMSAGLDDIDLSISDLVQRVNAELVGKIVNLGSRGAQMTAKRFQNQLCLLEEEDLLFLKSLQSEFDALESAYESRLFTKAIGILRTMADEGNRYFDEQAPWKLVDTDPKLTLRILTVTLNVFRLIAIGIKPVLPQLALAVSDLLNESEYDWQSSQQTLQGSRIKDYKHLATRLELAIANALISSTAEKDFSKMQNPTPKTPSQNPPVPISNSSATSSEFIEIEDFQKVDLRIAKIINAESIPQADKLLKLTLDFGELGHRTVFAGIKAAYTPERLIGKLTLAVANLKPRTMKFGVSEGMVLAAGPGGKDLFLMSPDEGAQPGQKVK